MNRSRFLAYASHAMRIDRRRFRPTSSSERRGGGDPHVPIDVAEVLSAAEDEIVRVGDALTELEAVDGRLVKVIEMRYFAGLSEPEIAESLALTDRTIRRDLKKARLLLSLALK